MAEYIGTDEQIDLSIFKAVQKVATEWGYTPDVDDYLDTEADAIRYEADCKIVQNTMGFQVKVFNQSSARKKAEKNSPRIVIFQFTTYEGEIGAPAAAIIAQSETDVSKFQLGFLPGQATNLIMAIHLISSTSKEFNLLNKLLAAAIGRRKYLQFYHKPTNTYLERRFLIYQSSFNNLDDAIEGISEKVYFYTVPDVYITPMEVIKDNISQITSITIDQKLEGKEVDNTIQVNSNDTN